MIQKSIDQLCLMDDIFTRAFFNDEIECIELVLQIIMDMPDLKVVESQIQKVLSNTNGRSVCLDVYATGSDGRNYDIEVQVDDKGADIKRARFNSALMDAAEIKSGHNYNELNESYVIFITEKDVLGKGLPIYHIDRYVKETGEPAYDGTHIIYVNNAIQDETALGRLMHDFSCTDADQMYYDLLANRTRFMKTNKEARKSMSSIIEQLVEESVAQKIVRFVENVQKKFDYDLQSACDLAECTEEEYYAAKKILEKQS